MSDAKFQAVNEIQNFSFDSSEILELKVGSDSVTFLLNGAVVKKENSQNSRFQDVYCAKLFLQLKEAKLLRLVKEGYKYYDADGNLMEEKPNEDVPVLEQNSVLARCSTGTIFTTVEDEAGTGKIYEFGIDVPKIEDEEEVDTYWLCIQFEESVAGWDKYLGPV